MYNHRLNIGLHSDCFVPRLLILNACCFDIVEHTNNEEENCKLEMFSYTVLALNVVCTRYMHVRLHKLITSCKEINWLIVCTCTCIYFVPSGHFSVCKHFL